MKKILLMRALRLYNYIKSIDMPFLVCGLGLIAGTGFLTVEVLNDPIWWDAKMTLNAFVFLFGLGSIALAFCKNEPEPTQVPVL